MVFYNRIKARRIQRSEKIQNAGIEKTVHTKCRVIHVKTEFGITKTLWYGNFENKQPLLFDLHGGGFVLGSPEMDHAINTKISQQADCKVVSIDYAKSPQHRYPYAIKQIISCINIILRENEKFGILPERIAIGGHSAGANLSAAVCLKIREHGIKFCCQILDYPPLDLYTSPFLKTQPAGCIPPKVAIMFDDCYTDPSQRKEIFVSPVFASIKDLAGNPPALIILAGKDSLFDEGKKYGEMLKQAGVNVTVAQFPEAIHGFTMGDSPDSTEAISQMIRFLKENFKKL